MAVTATKTVRHIVRMALRKIGAADPEDDSIPSELSDHAMQTLDMMLKSWQMRELREALRASQSVTLTTAASYTLSPVRPLELESVRFKKSGTETPMTRMSRNEYDTLPIKTTTGTPTSFYFDRQREAALLYVWPVLASASGETLEITYIREFEDITALGDTIDVPAEWYEAVIYNLAARLADDLEINKPMVMQRAEVLLRDLAAFDNCESVFFGGGDADG